MERQQDQRAGSHLPAKKTHRFGKVLGIYCIVLAVLFAAVLAVLWISLSRYQARVDAENAAEAEKKALAAAAAEADYENRKALQDAALRYAEETDAAAWTELYFQQPHPEYREAVTIALQDYFDANELRCYKAEGWTLEKPVYAIYRGDAPFARFAMKKSGELWTAADPELLLSGTRGGSVRVPADCAVTCGGVELNRDNAEITDVTLMETACYDGGAVYSMAGKTYTVSGLLTDPKFDVAAPAGLQAIMQNDGFYAPVLQSGERSELMRQKAEKLAKALVYYYLHGNQNTTGNMSAAASQTVAGSQANKVIRDSLDGVHWTNCFAGNYRCEVSAGDVLVWKDGERYSVDVAVDASGTYGTEVRSMDSAYRIFFTQTGEEFGITGLETK